MESSDCYAPSDRFHHHGGGGCSYHASPAYNPRGASAQMIFEQRAASATMGHKDLPFPPMPPPAMTLPAGLYMNCQNCSFRHGWPTPSRHKLCVECRNERAPLCGSDDCINLLADDAVPIADELQKCLRHIESTEDKMLYIEQTLRAVSDYHKTLRDYIAGDPSHPKDVSFFTEPENHDAPDPPDEVKPQPPSIKTVITMPFAEGIKISFEVSTPIAS